MSRIACRVVSRRRSRRTPVAWSIASNGSATPTAIRDRRGFALEATLIVLVLVGLTIGLAATWVISITRGAATDYRGSRVSYAAEAGADAVMAQLELAMEDGVISNAELGALTLPTLDGFTFEDMVVTRDPLGAEVRPINSGPYSGLFAITLPIDIAIAARDATNNRGSVVVAVTAQSIPLFQFGVFYEGDLEIHNGPRMDFEGWVHTNSNLYLSSDNTYFASRITTPGSVFWQRKAYSERLNGVYINNEAGTPVRLDFDSRSIPVDANFRSRSESKFNSRLMTKAHGVAPLRLPLPTGMAPIELIRPRSAADNPQAQAVKFAWKADWYIDLVLADPVALKNGDNLCSTGNLRGAAVSIRPVGRSLPDLTDCKKIFRFRPNAFRDGREDIGVDLLDVDVGALRTWIGSSTQRETNIIYVTFSQPSPNPPNGGRDYPAVRLVNAARLPNPITIATSAPVYVKGDYNSTGWQPSAILGDAVTFVSTNFDETLSGVACGSDTNACSGTYTKRGASPAGGMMKVYAATAAGHSPTPCDWQSCGNQAYGGGLENFPRFVEGWGGTTVLYRGSLVSLFPSVQAARHNWQWRGYYDAPNRDWKFDLRFQDPDNLPPGTPTVGNVFQTAFRPVF
jgi:hypothetical protein